VEEEGKKQTKKKIKKEWKQVSTTGIETQAFVIINSF